MLCEWQHWWCNINCDTPVTALAVGIFSLCNILRSLRYSSRTYRRIGTGAISLVPEVENQLKVWNAVDKIWSYSTLRRHSFDAFTAKMSSFVMLPRFEDNNPGSLSQSVETWLGLLCIFFRITQSHELAQSFAFYLICNSLVVPVKFRNILRMSGVLQVGNIFLSACNFW